MGRGSRLNSFTYLLNGLSSESYASSESSLFLTASLVLCCSCNYFLCRSLTYLSHRDCNSCCLYYSHCYCNQMSYCCSLFYSLPYYQPPLLWYENSMAIISFFMCFSISFFDSDQISQITVYLILSPDSQHLQ